jgi:adenylyltransferase/sulfurtransferase
MDFSDDELDRYARQLILKQVGGAGQQSLKAASIALVGLGGLGCPAALYLASAGIGRLTLIDDDVVSLSNLPRQILYTSADIGRAKVDAAADQLAAHNPHIHITPLNIRITPQNAATILAGHDLILDGSDSFKTRLVVNAAAVALKIPLVSGAIGPFDGQFGLFEGHLPDKPCYQCLTGPATDRPGQSCADQGVIGPTAGLIGSLMAFEAMRALIGFGTSASASLTIFDGLTGQSRRLSLPKDPRCPICTPSSGPTPAAIQG